VTVDDDRRDPLEMLSGGEGVITGTVVCAAAIAAGVGHLTTIGQLSIAILGTVLVYWLAHLHAVTLGTSLTHGHHPAAALRHAVAETLPIAAVSVVPLAVLVLANVLGVGLRGAAWTALVTTVGLLAVYSYAAGARGGLGPAGRFMSAGAGVCIGLLVVLLKVLLH
jgi:hypothetical protein